MTEQTYIVLGLGITALLTLANNVFMWLTRNEVKALHNTTNSRLDELIAALKTIAHAEGRAEGVIAGRAEAQGHQN